MDWLQALLTGVGRLLGSIADAIGADYARAGMITVGLYALAFILFGAWKYQQALAIAFQRLRLAQVREEIENQRRARHQHVPCGRRKPSPTHES